MSRRLLMLRMMPVWMVLMLSSCTNLSISDVYRHPEIKYVKTSIDSISFEELSAKSTVNVLNPNPYNIPITALKASLWLEDKPWLNLQNDAIEGLAAGDTVAVDFDWELIYAKLPNQAQAAYSKGEVALTLRLEPTLDVPLLGPQSMAWSKKFKLPIPKMPQIHLTGWSIESVSLATVKIALDLEIRNPNVFSMGADGWGLKLQSKGQATLANFSLDHFEINAGGRSAQTVNLEVSPLDIGLSLVAGLRQQRWPDALSIAWSGQWFSPDMEFKLPAVRGRISAESFSGRNQE